MKKAMRIDTIQQARATVELLSLAHVQGILASDGWDHVLTFDATDEQMIALGPGLRLLELAFTLPAAEAFDELLRGV